MQLRGQQAIPYQHLCRMLEDATVSVSRCPVRNRHYCGGLCVLRWSSELVLARPSFVAVWVLISLVSSAVCSKFHFFFAYSPLRYPAGIPCVRMQPR